VLVTSTRSHDDVVVGVAVVEPELRPWLDDPLWLLWVPLVELEVEPRLLLELLPDEAEAEVEVELDDPLEVVVIPDEVVAVVDDVPDEDGLDVDDDVEDLDVVLPVGTTTTPVLFDEADVDNEEDVPLEVVEIRVVLLDEVAAVDVDGLDVEPLDGFPMRVLLEEAVGSLVVELLEDWVDENRDEVLFQTPVPDEEEN
jgi:hypothetical protein